MPVTWFLLGVPCLHSKSVSHKKKKISSAMQHFFSSLNDHAHFRHSRGGREIQVFLCFDPLLLDLSA